MAAGGARALWSAAVSEARRSPLPLRWTAALAVGLWAAPTLAAPLTATSTRGLTATATATLELPPIEAAVTSTTLIGVGLAVDHYDAEGYPESKDGLLVTEVDREAGPIIIAQGNKPYYLEAQVTNVQRDAVLLARSGPRADTRPDGTIFDIPYGYGALKLNQSVVTLVEAKVVPHFSDNVKTYQLFALSDLYLGAALTFAGPRTDARFVYAEQYAGYAGVGLNLLALAGARLNATYGAFSVPLVFGGGYRYPALLTFLGTHWTTGAELVLGLGDADDAPATRAVIALPGLVHEIEWTWPMGDAPADYRADPRPVGWRQQALFARVGLYVDALSGSGGAGGVLVDVAVGWRFNLLGPTIPEHAFKETRVTYASERYIARKKEEEERRRQLEELMRRRSGG